MTSPRQETPWEAANVGRGDTVGLSGYAARDIAHWKGQMAENVMRSFLTVGQFLLRDPFTNSLADAVIGPGAELDGEIPSMQQVSTFLDGKWGELEDVSAALQPIIDVFSAVLKAFGGDFSGLADLPRVLLDRLASLFGGLPGLGVEDVFAGLERMFSGLFSNGGLDATKLVGELPMAIINTIKGFLSAVFDLGLLRITPNMIFGGNSDNLLLASDFKAAESMVVGDGWFWDGAVGRSAPGSAKATASGNRLVQLSNLVRVEAGQKLDVAGWVKWSGVAGSGDAFRVECQCYTGASTGASLPVGVISSPSASGGWQQINGQVTIPASVDGVRVRIAVEAAVTAGSVWWDDVTAVRVGTMPQNFITDLIPDLANLGDWITQLVQHGLGALGIPIVGDLLDQILDFADGLDDWMTDTDATASGLDSLLGNLLSNPASVIGTLPQSLISGLSGALAGLLSMTTWNQFLSGLTGSAGSGSGGSTGIPGLDGALNAIGSLFGKAQTAQTTAQTVQQTMQSQAITTSVLGDLTIVKTTFPTSGTWNRSAIPSGCTTRVYTEVQAINGGAGGGKPALPTVVTYQYNNGTSTTTDTYVVPGAVGRGGLDGGFASKVFDPSALGTSQSVVVGLGGAGATTNGANGADGGQSSFGGTLLQCVSGTSAIPSSRGPLATTARPGKGGDGGLFYNATIRTDTGNTSNTYGALAGGRGEPSAGAASPTGNGANGTAAVTDPTQLYGGSGANGGNAAGGTGTQTGTAGGVGGLPGGGGGGGGQAGSNATRNNGNGGNGGNGYVIVLEAFK